MKSFYYSSLLLLFSLFSFSSVNAQYQSLFGDSSSSWNVKVDLTGEPIAEEYFWSTDMHVSDTIVNGVNYQIVYRSFESGGMPVAYEMQNSLFVYEDTIQGISWYVLPDDTVKYYNYDLSLSAGDTFFLNSTDTSSYYLVDAVFTENNRIHQSLGVTYNSGADSIELELIEGIGANVGMASIHGHSLGTGEKVLLCYYQDADQLYATDLPQYMNRCWLYTGIDDLGQNHTSGVLYPNPVKDQLNLTELEFPEEFQILNIDGKVIRTGVIHPAEGLSVSELDSGIYLLILNSGDHYRFVKD